MTYTIYIVYYTYYQISRGKHNTWRQSSTVGRVHVES